MDTDEKVATGNFMSKKTNEENFKKYQERMEQLQRSNQLTPSPDLPPQKLIDHLASEGEKLLAKDPKYTAGKDESAQLTKTLAISSKNPYLRARIQILEKMPSWRKKEIAEMERTGNINNQFYDDFVHQVAMLGDSLGNK